MKVAFLTTDIFAKNGWGCYSREVIQRLPDYGIEPIVLVPKSARTKNFQGIPVHPVLKAVTSGPPSLKELIKIVWDARKITKDCQIIHSLVEPYLLLSGLLAAPNKSNVMTAHGTYAVSILNEDWKYFYRHFYQSVSLILSVSNYTATQVIQALPQVEKRIQAVPLGVTISNQSSSSLPAEEREDAFLMVGHVKARKGTLQAVTAMAEVVKKFPRAKLYIAGMVDSKTYIQKVKQVIQEKGIEDNIIWLGKVSDDKLSYLYGSVRGLVMPSMNIGGKFEGFGLVHLEANTFGTPAIGSRGCGNEDAIKDGYSGFLVEQGNIEQLTTAMTKLLDPSFDWQLMSNNALHFAESMSWSRLASVYAEAYKTMKK